MNEMNAQDMIDALRKQGYVVVAFHPDYLRDANPSYVEDRLTELGWDVIDSLANEESEA